MLQRYGCEVVSLLSTELRKQACGPREAQTNTGGVRRG